MSKGIFFEVEIIQFYYFFMFLQQQRPIKEVFLSVIRVHKHHSLVLKWTF